MLCLFESTIRRAASLISSKTSNSTLVKFVEQDTIMCKKWLSNKFEYSELKTYMEQAGGMGIFWEIS